MSFSAMQFAHVAPTFPAPTTVTFISVIFYCYTFRFLAICLLFALSNVSLIFYFNNLYAEKLQNFFCNQMVVRRNKGNVAVYLVFLLPGLSAVAATSDLPRHAFALKYLWVCTCHSVIFSGMTSTIP